LEANVVPGCVVVHSRKLRTDLVTAHHIIW
jgi:hypothetical protein